MKTIEKLLYIDCETVGNKPEEKPLVLPTADEIKVGNIKDPIKIKDKIDAELPKLIAEAKKKHAEAFDKEWRGNALKSLKSKIICISYAFGDGEVQSLVGEEKEIIQKLEAVLIGLGNDMYSISPVAHNGFSFDYIFLRHRAMKYRCKKLLQLMPVSKYSEKAKDTQEMLRGTDYKSFFSMNDACAFFGLKGKGDMDGSKVHDAYINGKIKEIASYCDDDVRILRELYKKIVL